MGGSSLDRPKIESSERRSEYPRRASNCLLDDLVCLFYLTRLPRGRLQQKTRVRQCMIANSVALIVDLLHQFRISSGVFPEEKKCGLEVSALQNVENFWSRAWMWSIVKCQMDRWIIRVPQN